MTPKMRAESIAEIARRGDEGLTKSVAYDMILNSMSQERESCAEIVDEYARQAGNDEAGGIAHAIAQAIRARSKELL